MEESVNYHNLHLAAEEMAKYGYTMVVVCIAHNLYKKLISLVYALFFRTSQPKAMV